jgi:DNA-binding XRE family transcriptional regulator
MRIGGKRERDELEIYNTQSGIQKYLPSNLRTAKLKEWAFKRGERLNLLRSFVEYNNTEGDKVSLDDLAKSIELNSGTLGRLERGETCLSVTIATWIARQVLQRYSIFVTANWLLALSDAGEPRVINTNFDDLLNYFKSKIENLPSEKEAGDQEMLSNYILHTMYNKLFDNVISAYVRDNRMSPFYEKGDVVMGQAINLKDIRSCHKKKCIIIRDNLKIVRFVHVINDTSILLTEADVLGEVEVINKLNNVVIAPITHTSSTKFNEEFGVAVDSGGLHLIQLEA